MVTRRFKRTYLTAFVVLAIATGVMVSMALTSARAAEAPAVDQSGDPAYIKFDGLDGEASDKAHKGWSDLISFQQAIYRTPPTTGAIRGRGDVKLEDIQVIKEIDKSSPKLAEAVLRGRVFPKVEIHLARSYGEAGRVTYYAYELKNVMVVSYNVGGWTTGEDLPMEDVTLNFEEIKVTYTENDARGAPIGTVEYTWNVREATP